MKKIKLLYDNLNYFRKDLFNFFHNVIRFKDFLWRYRWWDYSFMLIAIKIAVNDMAKKTEKYGIEVEVTRNKKIAKMKRLVELIDIIYNAKELEIAQEQLNLKLEHNIRFHKLENDNYQMINDISSESSQNNDLIYETAKKIEKESWDEFFQILKGQNLEDIPNNSTFEEYFDGTGIRTWWD